MDSGGDVGKSVLQVGGLAGFLAGVSVVIALILGVLQLPPPGFEGPLMGFPQVRALTTASIHLFSLALLLGLPFLAALYWSLRDSSRPFARIGLGSGVLAFVITIVALQGLLMTIDALSGIYADASSADRPGVLSVYWAVSSVLSGVINGGFLFTGLAFLAFGFAMRGSSHFQDGFAWLSAGLGILIVLLVFLIPPIVAAIVVAILFLVLGWKVYRLSAAA